MNRFVINMAMAFRKQRNISRAIALTGLAVSLSVAADSSPVRVMSGYTGYFLGGGGRDHVERMIDALGDNGFNAIDVKIQQSLRKCDIDGHVPEVKALVDRAREKGLKFNVYIYPVPHHGRRVPEWPEHAVLPAPVDMYGHTVSNAFLLTDPAVFGQLFHHAFRFAALRSELGFASLRFDVETLSLNVSYDDATWAAFCAAEPTFSPATPAAGRASALLGESAGDRYAAFFRRRVTAAVAAIVRKLREIDPAIELGYMPAEHHALAPCLDETLATEGVPAWLDAWDMYNGSGYVPSIRDRAEAVRKSHPMNRFIVWLRPNSYRLSDIAPSVYHAAANTDGYSMWSLAMLDDALKHSPGMALPGTFTGADYLAEFKRANAALRADMAAGTLDKPVRISAAKVVPLVAPLSWEDLAVPALRPAGDGTGPDRAITLRDPRTVFIYAQAGQSIRVTLGHLAGAARPISLQYALLDGKGALLRNEAVNPGATDTFAVAAPETGMYALRVSGGSGGQAWYSVNVAAPLHWAVDARDSAYLFGPQTFYVTGAGKGGGNPTLRIQSSAAECFRVALNDGIAREIVRTPVVDIALPPGVVKVVCKKSPISDYAQNFRLSFPEGETPLVFPVRERRLEFAK